MWIHIVVWIGLAAAAWLLRKKRSKWNVAILSLIAAGNLVGNILSFQEYQTSRETDRRVERNEDSDMTCVRKYRVSVEGESEEWKVQLEIPDRIYTEEESEQIFGEAMEKLDTVILGENESFDNISRKMELVTALPDCPVKIEWNTLEKETELDEISLEFTKTIRIIEFLGYILKNYSLSIKRKPRIKIINLMYNSSIKLMGALYDPLNGMIDTIIEIVDEKAKEDKEEIAAKSQFKMRINVFLSQF